LSVEKVWPKLSFFDSVNLLKVKEFELGLFYFHFHFHFTDKAQLLSDNMMFNIPFFLAAAAASFGFAVAQDFQEISDVPQTAVTLAIGLSCTGGENYPNLMFTIEPADSVTVSTSPPDLVTVIEKSNALYFEFNSPVASKATSGGIKIGMPADQLQSLIGSAASQVQIFDGFTSILSLDFSGASTLTANLSSNAAPFSLKLSGASTLKVKSGSNILRGDISGASMAIIEAPSFEVPTVTGASTLLVDGSVVGATVSGASTMTVSGAITGSVNNSGASTINGGTCSDQTNNSGASVCNDGEQDVTVTIAEQPTTLSGNQICWGSGGWGSGGWGSGSSSMRSYRTGASAAAVAAAFLAM
jgi:hypothetical protein